jgi:hypothetical protein
MEICHYNFHSLEIWIFGSDNNLIESAPVTVPLMLIQNDVILYTKWTRTKKQQKATLIQFEREYNLAIHL